MHVDFDYKIRIPQRNEAVVARPRLIERLRSLAGRRLITLTAPAGYGKTTLLVEFAQAQHELPIAWYSLDQYDVDPWQFLAYLAAAVDRCFPGALPTSAALFATQTHTPFATAAASVLREIYAIGQDFLLVIDDWHLVDGVQAISDLLATLLIRCQNCRVVLASRIYPSLPDMMLLAARRQMAGLDEELLRFDSAEVAAVLALELNREVSTEHAAALAERANGWIAGILLAAQSDDRAQAPLITRGGERQIYRFLAEQVLDQQPNPIQNFMFASSLLDELVAERCDAVLGRNDSAAMIEAIVRRRNFIVEITPGTYRYHPLFREFLQEHFFSTDTGGFHSVARAVAAYACGERRWGQAFDIYLRNGDIAGACQVLNLGGEELYTSGRIEMLERWFERLPLDALDAPPIMLKARVALNRGLIHEAEALADVAQRRIQADEEPMLWLLRAQVERVKGRYPAAVEYGTRALSMAQHAAQRAAALNVLATCELRAGNAVRSIELLTEALAIEQQRGDFYAVALIQQDLGICYREMGELARAIECYSRADAYWSISSNVGRRALTLNSRGVAEHLLGDYRAAYATLRQALRFAEELGTAVHQALVMTSLGDLYCDLGLLEQAQEAYDDARQAGGSAYLMSYLTLARLQLLVRQRHYDVAEDTIIRLAPELVAQHESTILRMQARIAIGRGERAEGVRYAEQALGTTEATDSRARALAQLTLAYAHSVAPGNPVAVVAGLEQARTIAEKLGYSSFLSAEAMSMASLLRFAQAAGWSQALIWRHQQQNVLVLGQMLSANDHRPLLIVRSLGSEQILVDGQPVEIGWARAREVLHFLLANPAGGSTDLLREAIWPELPADQSRGALKTAVYQLRKVLPADLIGLQGRQTYKIDRSSVRVDYDLDRFCELSASNDVDLLHEAIDLYQGSFLPSSENAWSASMRAYLEQSYLSAIQRAAISAEHHGAHAEALVLYRRILATDPLQETAHSAVMRCQLALNNRAAAIEQYHALRKLLHKELGLDISPASEAASLYQKVLNN
jgi:ATP/maltotriose-dependent transcriptional regulator MalT/DNA-binding SARP family transcriptional activator